MKKLLSVLFLFILGSSIAQKHLVLSGLAPDFYIEHTIKENETFLRLGSLYNISPIKVATYNSVTLSHNLTPGEVVKIPITTQNLQQKNEAGTYEIAIPVYYRASSNEQLEDLSKKLFGVPVDLLKEWNGVSAEKIAGATQLIVGYLRVKKELASYFSGDALVKNDIEKVKPNTPVAEKKPQVASETRLPEQAHLKTIDSTKTKIEEPLRPDIDSIQNIGSDALFEMARKAAFNNSNYPLAIRYCKTALNKSPTYSDIRIFLGRMYTWTSKNDSARQQFDYVIQTDSNYTDAYVAYSDLEYWNDRYEIALSLVNKGLDHNQNSKELLLRKAKILNKLNRSKEASTVIGKLVKLDPKNTEARSLSAKMREAVSGNVLGINYDYTYFDKQFKDPWHIASIDYSRQTNIGSFSARFSYANRFKSSGLQYELEGYPNISKSLYSYVDFAYSKDVGIFPNYRGGFSLYASLPKSFEGEVGFRYLNFGDGTWIYTAAVGKYYKSWLFNARTYLTPGTVKISQSYNASARYYYGGAYDYVGLVIGTGISPDERPSALLLNSNYKLISQKASATYKHEIKSRHIITVSASWINNEYLPKTKGNQLEGGLSYQIRL